VRRLILIPVLAALLLAGGGATASASTIAGTAFGSYGFAGTASGSVFDVRPFSFWVIGFKDGSAVGRFDYRQVRDGVELTAKGPLTCATIRGKQAWVGGTIAESSRPSLVGLEMWFQVQDNSIWGGNPDMSSTLGAGGPGTGAQYCVDAPVVRFPFFLDSGFLAVVDL
jgi:hypothetical protein